MVREKFGMAHPTVRVFHHKDTSTGTFLVIDEATKKSLVIDTCGASHLSQTAESLVDFNYNNCSVSHQHADEVQCRI